MSNFEIFLIVMACAVPIVALLFVFPKFKKKESKDSAVLKTLEEVKKEETQEESKTDLMKERTAEKMFPSNDFSSDDFRDYINYKQNNITRPTRVELPQGFVDRTEPYVPRHRRRMQEKPKTIAEEIRSLSPELKALIFTGALDKKNFD